MGIFLMYLPGDYPTYKKFLTYLLGVILPSPPAPAFGAWGWGYPHGRQRVTAIESVKTGLTRVRVQCALDWCGSLD